MFSETKDVFYAYGSLPNPLGPAKRGIWCTPAQGTGPGFYRLALHRNALRIARPPGINARSARQAPPRHAVVAAARTSTSR